MRTKYQLNVFENEKEKGGTISEIVFKHGTQKNILIEPLSSMILLKEGNNYNRYYESECKNPEIMIEEKETIVLTSCGTYTRKNGQRTNIKYTTTYHYKDYGLVSITLELNFLNPVKNIISLSILKFSVCGSLNTAGYIPYAQSGFHPSSFEKVIWKEFVQTPYYNNALLMEKFRPAYFCIIQRRVEGIEIFSPDIIEDNSFFNNKENTGFYQARYQDIKNIVEIEFSPYGEWQLPVSMKKGKYLFSYFLGLPFSKGENVVHRPYFHASIDSRWPNEKQLDILAKSGVKLIRLHNDYREDGPFWHDGCYPPYDKENMKKMDWVIEQVHKRGMKIVPYFSLKELHPDAPEYKKSGRIWKRTIDRKYSMIHNYAGTGEFGAQMCLCSGWKEFRKKSIDTVLKKHSFDGVYYDWVASLHCNNPAHYNGKQHTDIEQLIDLIFWTRKRVGPNGIVFLHLSGVPVMVIENTADIVYTHEDLPWLAPYPGDFSPESDFAGITGHQITTCNLCTDSEKEKFFTLSCFLEGLWVCPRNISDNDPVIKEMKKFSQYDLTSYQFQPASEKPVHITSTNIYASLYWKKDSALIYVANLSNQKTSGNLHANFTLKNWTSTTQVRIKSPYLMEKTDAFTVGKLFYRN
ncbi:MAG TPA: DUF6259 domain-containing protein [bacterium]|nr:DUF6259 domain-containing protein [bacterium]HOL35404.1 DUF6259 domain-containing protein [bacterium]HPP09167.1 DUF6259 domain-containing protein [bacterium]